MWTPLFLKIKPQITMFEDNQFGQIYSSKSNATVLLWWENSAHKAFPLLIIL